MERTQLKNVSHFHFRASYELVNQPINTETRSMISVMATTGLAIQLEPLVVLFSCPVPK